jgi:hypothetical protein
MENPPSGVLAYYWLQSAARQPLKLELLDSSGAVRACAASDTAGARGGYRNAERSGNLGTTGAAAVSRRWNASLCARRGAVVSDGFAGFGRSQRAADGAGCLHTATGRHGREGG